MSKDPQVDPSHCGLLTKEIRRPIEVGRSRSSGEKTVQYDSSAQTLSQWDSMACGMHARELDAVLLDST
jgi:hypothetical protein